jgi:hypothetical protein
MPQVFPAENAYLTGHQYDYDTLSKQMLEHPGALRLNGVEYDSRGHFLEVLDKCCRQNDDVATGVAPPAFRGAAEDLMRSESFTKELSKVQLYRLWRDELFSVPSVLAPDQGHDRSASILWSLRGSFTNIHFGASFGEA